MDSSSRVHGLNDEMFMEAILLEGNYQLNRDKFEVEADKMYQQLDLEKWKLNNEEIS